MEIKELATDRKCLEHFKNNNCNIHFSSSQSKYIDFDIYVSVDSDKGADWRFPISLDREQGIIYDAEPQFSPSRDIAFDVMPNDPPLGIMKIFNLKRPEAIDLINSLDAAEKIAAIKEGKQLAQECRTITYGGKVIGVTECHVVQSIGKSAVIHEKRKLDQIPANDEMVDIAYDGKGHGKVGPYEKEKEQYKAPSR